MALRGSDGTNSHWVGTLKPASAARAKARSSSRSGGSAGSVGTTKALIVSPSSRSGTPITAALGDPRVLEEAVFHLLRVDVLAAPDDHVAAPADQVEVAVVTDPAQVTGV